MFGLTGDVKTHRNRENNAVRKLQRGRVCDLEICTCVKVELRPQGHSLAEEASDAAAAH